jgi:hypothetical protein
MECIKDKEFENFIKNLDVINEDALRNLYEYI